MENIGVVFLQGYFFGESVELDEIYSIYEGTGTSKSLSMDDSEEEEKENYFIIYILLGETRPWNSKLLILAS